MEEPQNALAGAKTRHRWLLLLSLLLALGCPGLILYGAWFIYTFSFAPAAEHVAAGEPGGARVFADGDAGLIFILVGGLCGLAVLFVNHYRSQAGERVRLAHRWVAFAAKYGDVAMGRQLANGNIWQGMSEEQLTDSLGKPVEVDRSALKTKTKDVWKYGRTGKNRFATRVTVENGEVVGWDIKS